MRPSRADAAKKRAALLPFLQEAMPAMLVKLNQNAGGDFLALVEEYEAKRNAFIRGFRGIPLGSESFMVVLRRWNSYTPSLPVASSGGRKLSQHSVGGGYFLHIQSPLRSLASGYGLVIDPGYNFIHNFGSAGFCLDDIDGVLMTHAHNDHTNDFESILSLLFQRNGRHAGLRQPKKVDLFMNVGAFKKFSNYLDLANKRTKDYIGKVVVMSPGQRYSIPEREDLSCEIFTLFTNHHEIVTADYALGLCVKASDCTILFTGDTGWRFDTAVRNESFLHHPAQGVDKIDVLVAHIGTVKRKEFTQLKERDVDDSFYDKHLGMLGCICSIEQWKPRLAIISEFGEELANAREALVRQMQIACSTFPLDTRCIPGDVGLFLLLDTGKAVCYRRKALVAFEKIDYKEVRTREGRVIRYFSASRRRGRDNLPEASNGLLIFRAQHFLKNMGKGRGSSRRLSRLVSRLIASRREYEASSDVQQSDHLVALAYAVTAAMGDVVGELKKALQKGIGRALITKVMRNYGIAPGTLARKERAPRTLPKRG